MRIRVSESRVLWRVLGQKGDEVTEGCAQTAASVLRQE
jgi:hypothetical protein